MTYDGPKKIVILGGGLAGLAAADAITKALEGKTLPPGLEITLVEGENRFGGRAVNFDAEDPAFRALHPMAPAKVKSPHGIHFVWHGYKHFFDLVEGIEDRLSPSEPVATYNLILAPPDRPGGPGVQSKISALHIVNPSEPESAWDPRAQAILRAYRRGAPGIDWLTDFVREHFMIPVDFTDAEPKIEAWLSFLDILFNEEDMSPQLRWGLFAAALVAGELGEVERNDWLRDVLDGRSPQDIEIGELMQPLFADVIAPQLQGAAGALRPFIRPGDDHPPESLAAAVWDTVTDNITGLFESVRSRITGLLSGTPLAGITDEIDDAGDVLYGIYSILRLIVEDAATILSDPEYDPRKSGYLKNIYKAAFSSPFGLDAATALRDIQFGHRDFDGGRVQLFDGDDCQFYWNAIRDRIQARFDGGISGRIASGTWAKKLIVDATGVSQVELTDSVTRPRPFIPTVQVCQKGATTETLSADIVVSSLLPAGLAPLIKGAQGDGARFVRDVRTLGKFANETVNLQLFFPEKISLPFKDPPAGSSEQKPFSISNLEGIFTILVDLERGWKPATFEAVRLSSSDTGPFTGSAIELVGSWADVFTHDPLAHPGRYQWPPGVLRMLARFAQDPDDIEPWSVDPRPWVHDIGAAGYMAPPVFGEVRMDRRDAYYERWVEEVTPLVVSHTLLSIAALPGMSEDDVVYLEDEARAIVEKRETDVRWIFTRSCQAENKFYSAEPFLYDIRPHARFETPIQGLWCAGDWTRNGLDVQCMEGAIVSGLQAAYGVIEAMRAGGMDDLEPPRIHPDILPPGAWDPGDEV